MSDGTPSHGPDTNGEQSLPWFHALNRAVLNSLGMAVCTLDPSGAVQSLNHEAVRLLGWSEAACRGRFFHDLTQCTSLTHDASQGSCPIAHVLHTGKPLWLPRANFHVRSGESLVVELTCTPLVDEGTSGVVLSFRDLADQIRMEEDLRRLASIPEESPFPIVELDVQANMLYANPSMTRLMQQAGFRDEGFSAALPCNVQKIVERCLIRGLSEQEVEIDVGHRQYAWLFCPLQELRLVRGYGIDVTERKIAADELGQFVEVLGQKNIELDAALTKAEAATRAKAAFLATMSHEIRTPLNGIIGMTALLSESSLSVEQREDAETIQKSAEGLLTIINDILDFSKIESGKLEFEAIEFDLRALLEDVLDLLALRAHDKGLHLAGLVSPDVPRGLRGDPLRLRQILTNLIGNAIKFTDYGEVVVEINPRTCDFMDESSFGPDGLGHVELHFSVRDTGIGLTSDGQRRLFQAFSQADSTTTRKYGGTGLGLAISKQLTELMGGTIGVSSVANQGSEFWVTLPFDFDTHSTQSIPSQNIQLLKGQSVLLLETHEPTRRGIEHSLELIGVSCISLDSLTDAMQTLQDRPADLPVYDMAIIDCDGFRNDPPSIFQQLHESMGQNVIPLIPLLRGNRRGSELSLELKKTVWLTKPVRRSRLYKCLLSIVQQPDSLLKDGQLPVEVNTPNNEIEVSAPSYGFQGRVLLVEDNPINMKVVLGMLQKTGVVVDAVVNGHEACRTFSQRPYDLVFMDWQMPEMDGLEATREIRRREAEAASKEESLTEQPATSDQPPDFPHVPIIAMTANAMPGDREKCLAAGMDDYLVKPLRMSAVVDMLAHWLSPNPSSPNAQSRATRNSNSDHTESSNIEHRDNRDTSEIGNGQPCWSPDVALAHMDGDQALLQELIELFLASTPKTLSKIREALDQQNLVEAGRTAHTLKGSVGAFRAEQVVMLVGDFERLANEQQVNSVESAYQQLNHAVEQLLQELQDYVNSHCVGKGS